MVLGRFTKYIEVDSVECFKIDFLKDIPERIEKGEFNCTLCHSLSRLFALAKNCKPRSVLATCI